jgi:NosR/NirI family transcriptional regulator, nitrous oxide reductase regulator
MPSTRLRFFTAISVLTWLIPPANQTTRLPFERLFPGYLDAERRISEPPHFVVFGAKRVQVGYAFWTTELAPLERGYDGPIKILVGMTARGILTGIVVVEHHEPYGNFSVDTPAFAAQFAGKSVRDPFKVGEDIDAVSRATISISSAVRAIKTSARLAARRLITAQQ